MCRVARMINASCQFCFWDPRIVLTHLHPSSVWAILVAFCLWVFVLLVILRHCQTPRFCFPGSRGRVMHRLFACLHGGSFLCLKLLTTKLQLPLEDKVCLPVHVYACCVLTRSSLYWVSCLCDESNCFLTMVFWFNLMTKHNPSSLSGQLARFTLCLV